MQANKKQGEKMKEKGLTPYSELVSDLSKGQRAFLLYKLMNFEDAEAARLASRKEGTIGFWRNDEAFLEIERKVMIHRIHYRDEKFGDGLTAAAMKVQVGLEMLAEKMVSWDDLKVTEKNFILRAAKMILDNVPKTTKTESYSYAKFLSELKKENAEAV